MTTTRSPDEYHEEENHLDDAPAFFSPENLKITQVQVVGGMLNGFSIGFVGVYANFYLNSTDCSRYKTEAACSTVSNAECAWDAARSACGWTDFTCNWSYKTECACLADDRCNWEYGEDKCTNPVGYTSTYNGIFAGAMIVGAMIGSIGAGQFASRFGHKKSFLIVGIVGVVSSILYHVSAATDEFWVLCAGRLMIGVVLGLVCVACPMYVDQNSHPKHSKTNGVMFQVFTTFGIMFAALMGLALGQSANYEKNVNMAGRMQGFCTFSTLLSLLMVVLGIVLGESKTKFSGGKQEAGSSALNPNEYSYMQMIGPLTMGTVTAGTLQLTGINAVMNYAPDIMDSFGMQPLVGNFVVMTWNFVTALVSIPLASRFTMRQLFLVASLVAATSCLVLCGIPVYPGVADKNVKNGVAITGIAIFIAAFEFGVGPCFFVLSQDLFPRSFRPKGSSFVLMMQFIFNIIINVCYPIATEGISGGASGNQDKGQSVAFIFFGSIGLVCFVLQALFLFPWEENGSQAIEEDDHLKTNEHSPIDVSTPGNRNVA